MRRTGVIATTLLSTLVSGLLAVSAQPAQAVPPAPPVPGGRSAGDRLFPAIGNSGYFVSHYDVALRWSPRSRGIVATTQVTARAPRPLSSYSLDLQGLRVTAVSVAGRRAAWSRSGHKLVVRPSRPVAGRFVTTVRYRGRPVTHIDPDGSKDGWIPTADGATVLSEPVGAMTWFPCNNTPRDKATFRVRVTVPRGLAVAGNGDLVRHRHAGSLTWVWTDRSQQATYLAMISIGRYHVYRSRMTTSSGRRLPVLSFVEPRFGSLARLRRLLPQVVRFEERRFGPYPFSSVGMVVKRLGVDYALETQTRPVFDGRPGATTLVHELAHQWYGDSVTPRQWEDVWLNEGFASYAEDLWVAGHGGPSTSAAFRTTYDRNAAGSRLWRPAPARFTDPADLFGDPVYVRGGMTLEALRQRIGTPALYTLLRRWAATRRGASVDTAQLVALAGRVSRRDLGTFFRTWLYVPEKPRGY